MQVRSHLFALLAGGLGVLHAAVASAGPIYLNIPNVTGPVTVPEFRGDIALLAYSQGFARPDITGAKTICGAVNFTKNIDETSIHFLMYATTGQVIPTATIYFAQVSGAAVVVPYSITLTNATVVSIQASDASFAVGPVGITESVSVQVEKFAFTFRPIMPNGTLGAPQTTAWNCLTNSPG